MSLFNIEVTIICDETKCFEGTVVDIANYSSTTENYVNEKLSEWGWSVLGNLHICPKCIEEAKNEGI